jgi:hypothetical protein
MPDQGISSRRDSNVEWQLQIPQLLPIDTRQRCIAQWQVAVVSNNDLGVWVAPPQ